MSVGIRVGCRCLALVVGASLVVLVVEVSLVEVGVEAWFPGRTAVDVSPSPL